MIQKVFTVLALMSMTVFMGVSPDAAASPGEVNCVNIEAEGCLTLDQVKHPDGFQHIPELDVGQYDDIGNLTPDPPVIGSLPWLSTSIEVLFGSVS